MVYFRKNHQDIEWYILQKNHQDIEWYILEKITKMLNGIF